VDIEQAAGPLEEYIAPPGLGTLAGPLGALAVAADAAAAGSPRRARDALCAAALFGIPDGASRDTIAAQALALIQSRIGCAHHPLCEIAAGTGDAVECADSETRRDRELAVPICERLRPDTLAQPVGHGARLGCSGVGKHNGEFVAADRAIQSLPRRRPSLTR